METVQKIQITGKIQFDPENITKKHENQSTWKYTAMVLFDCNVDAYYRWFLNKRFNLNLVFPLRNPHVTFINDKVTDLEKYYEGKAKWDGETITVEYELDPRSNGKHWWMRVISDELKSIREDCGLTFQPYFGLHLSLGYVNDRDLEFSEYILRQRINFGI